MRKTFLAALGLGGAQTAGISAAVVDDTIRQALTDKPRANPDGSFYLPSTPETITWGHLPNASSTPVLTVPSGATVTIDTLSHEGLLEDQGKDPLAYFGHLGIPRAQILEEAIAIAALPHDFGRDGPHVVTGPIAIEGARPGDWLRIETIRLESRVPYGIISNRHGKGALPGEYPTKAAAAHPNAAHPDSYGNISVLARAVAGQGEIATARGPIRFPLAPFVGLMGIAPNTKEPVHSVPPGHHGGNLDVRLLGPGSALYLPVQVHGAMFYAGDPHFAQGNGEVALTALEASLRATFRLSVEHDSATIKALAGSHLPFAETERDWIAIGLDPDLNLAMQQAVRAAIDFLVKRTGAQAHEVYAYLSAAASFEVSQVVDRTKGIHGVIRKADFAALLEHET